jgi:D-alanyl-D-alanine carboxypeptidase
MDIKIIYDEQRHRKHHNPKRMAFTILIIALLFIIVGLIIFGNYASETIATSKLCSYSSEINSAVDSTVSAVSQQNSSKINSSAQASIFQQSSDWNLVLVNMKVKLPQNFQPQIVNYDDKVKVDKRIVSSYESMKKAAAKAGVSLWISSGYRSEEEQTKLFEDEVKIYLAKGLTRNKAEIQAQQSVARPGYIEHNTGLALDFNGLPANFDKTNAYAWLAKHSSEYGFILRYPKGKEKLTGIEFEPWHFRYVGIKNAKAVTTKNMCLEEYVSSLANNK